MPSDDLARTKPVMPRSTSHTMGFIFDLATERRRKSARDLHRGAVPAHVRVLAYSEMLTEVIAGREAVRGTSLRFVWRLRSNYWAQLLGAGDEGLRCCVDDSRWLPS